MDLSTLIKNATKGANSRGHLIGNWNIYHSERNSVANSKCILCGLELQCNSNPLPNQIDISGNALALNCAINGLPNLDLMEFESLASLWGILNTRKRFVANRLFGDKDGKIVAMKELANYIANKITALDLRESGRMTEATIYDSIASGIYNCLPQFAKWR
jgi:hypothetical protein